jgi:hypothetical protein
MTIPKSLHEHINTAYPTHVCLIGTTLPNGYAQVTPRGSTMVFDDELRCGSAAQGSTNANLADGTKVTVFFRKPPLRDSAQGLRLGHHWKREEPTLQRCIVTLLSFGARFRGQPLAPEGATLMGNRGVARSAPPAKQKGAAVP